MSKRLFCFVLIVAAVFSLFPITANAVAPVAEAAASAAILVDRNSGLVLYEKNADTAVNPASTTKIMTALLVFDAIAEGKLTLADKVTATNANVNSVEWDASRVNPYIAEGEVLTVEDLLYCVMLHSDCVACNILAVRVAGSVDNFVAMMNTKAQQLGCTNTNFVNTHGYTAQGHLATARSLYLITDAAMRHEGFRKIVGAQSYTVPATNKFAARTINNTNVLLSPGSSYYYEFATGVKTGHTESAGYCLCSTAQKDGRELICVVLGANATTLPDGTKTYDSFAESKRLLEWGFSAYSNRTVISAGDIVSTVKVEGSNNEFVGLYAGSGANYLIPSDVSGSDIISTVSLFDQKLSAPVSAGDALGELTVTYNGAVIGRSTLYASRDIAVYTPDTSGNYVILMIILLVVVVLTAVTVMIIAFEGNKKQKGPQWARHSFPKRRDPFYDDYDDYYDEDGDFFGDDIPEDSARHLYTRHR